MIKLKVVGPNQTQVHFNSVTLFFSYDTLVAIRDEGMGKEYRTEEKYSATTSKHLNAWCNNSAEKKPQTFIDNYIVTRGE